jgi:Prealbumin-like fold domain
MKKLFSYLILLFFSCAVFGFFAVPKAHATVGSITLDGLTAVGNEFSASGTWQPRGNQCWVPAQGGDPGAFHYRIDVVDLTAGGTLLTTIDPAPCNGDYIGPVADANRGTGGVWPAPPQVESPLTFPLTQGNTICALLIHVNINGHDKVWDGACTKTAGPPHLIVYKTVVNDNGGTKNPSDFTMNVSGTNVSNPSFNGSESGTDVTLDVGSYSVSEGDHTGYTQSPSEDCTGTIAAGETKICTIVNDDIAPQLTVVKHVINDNGGNNVAGDFTMTVTGINVKPNSGFAGTESPGTNVTLDVGSYSVAESGPSGYTESDSADCSGSIAIGETKTCTITNDDQPAHITLVKSVTNDNGGTAAPNDFGISIDGNSVVSGATTDVDSNTSHTLNEVELSGYQFVSLTGGTKCPTVLGGTATLDEGESLTCTITNDDIAPQLIVIKNVVTTLGSYVNNDASDFTMIISGTVTPSGNITFDGSENGVTTILPMIGSYSVTETGPGGYKAGYGNCSGTIALGETKTCTVTNTALPGRMTGGGSVLAGSYGKITHGFELHCGAINVPNNLEINWNDKSGKSQKFHLNSLTSGACSMTTGGNPAPPPDTANGFNKFIGTGIGTLNGKPGASIAFTFVDNGEPGKKDTARYLITASGGSTAAVTTGDILLTQGNHQAHLY